MHSRRDAPQRHPAGASRAGCRRTGYGGTRHLRRGPVRLAAGRAGPCAARACTGIVDADGGRPRAPTRSAPLISSPTPRRWCSTRRRSSSRQRATAWSCASSAARSRWSRRRRLEACSSSSKDKGRPRRDAPTTSPTPRSARRRPVAASVGLPRRRAAGRRARPAGRAHPQPDAVRIPGAVHQGAGPHRAGRAIASPRARARHRLYGRRAGGVRDARLPAARRAGGRHAGRLGLPAAVPGHRRDPGLCAVRRRLEPLGRLPAGIVASRASASAWRSRQALPARSSPACWQPWWRRRARLRSWRRRSGSR